MRSVIAILTTSPLFVTFLSLQKLLGSSQFDTEMLCSKSFIQCTYFLFLCAQLCMTLFDPMNRSPPGSSVHGISQEKILEWVAIFSSRDLPDPEIQPTSSVSPALAGRFFTPEPSGKSILLSVRLS